MVTAWIVGFLMLVLVLIILVVAGQGGEHTPGTGAHNNKPSVGAVGAARHTGARKATLETGPLVVSLLPGAGARSRTPNFTKTYTNGFPMQTGAVVAFEIMFHPGYEWSCRGKVGGLYIGTGKATGGDYSPTGSTHRLMWGTDGNAFSYVYVPAGTQSRQPAPLNTTRNYGQGVFESDFKRAFTTGKWHHVELGVRLNTPGKTDGAMMLSIDGKTRTLDGILWRPSNQDVRSFRLNAFHGGGCLATRLSKFSMRNITLHHWA